MGLVDWCVLTVTDVSAVTTVGLHVPSIAFFEVTLTDIFLEFALSITFNFYLTVGENSLGWLRGAGFTLVG